MDDPALRCARRLVGYTLAIAAALGVPALVQALLILRPGMLPAEYETAVISCVLAASLVVVPVLVTRLLPPGDRR